MTDIKDDDKKTPSKAKETEPGSSKTKGPMVSVYLFSRSNVIFIYKQAGGDINGNIPLQSG